MPINVQIKATGLVPKISASQIRKLMTAGMWRMAFGWHRGIRGDHFTSRGARRYNYAKRKTKNVRTGKVKIGRNSKRPLSPSGLPLVWTGRTRTLSDIEDITANSKTSAARYKKVRALNFRPGGINMRREFTTLLPSEERLLAKGAEQHLRKQFSKGKKNITVR